MSIMVVRTRFCPSPSGKIHIGNARVAVFNALYAKKYNGVFILRIEDTDKDRSKQLYIDAVCEDLSWLGLKWQEGYSVGGKFEHYQQSKRYAIYDYYLAKLQNIGQVYPCFCTPVQLENSRKIQLKMGKPPRYDRSCRNLTNNDKPVGKHTIRFKIDDTGITKFNDSIKGWQDYDNKHIGDFIIKRSEGAYAFFFVNAIDDALMEISNSIRGEDHLSNTPRQIMILRLLGLKEPKYAHTSLIIGNDNKPLSKRNGSISIAELRNSGYLAIAVINYLARLGHKYDNNNVLSFSQLAQNFNFDNISKSSTKFDIKHLQYWQQLALNSLSYADFWDYIKDFVGDIVIANKHHDFIDLIKNNILFASDSILWAKIIFSNAEVNNSIAININKEFFETVLYAIDNYNDYDEFLTYIKNTTKLKGKDLFLPLRILLSSQESGPEIKKIFTITNKKILLNRVKYYYKTTVLSG